MILPMLFDRRMFTMTLPRTRIEMLCHERERSFLSMAQYGAKRNLERQDQHQCGPPWGMLLAVKGTFGSHLFPFDCCNRSCCIFTMIHCFQNLR